MPHKDPEARRVYNRAYYAAHIALRVANREKHNADLRRWRRAWRSAHPAEAKARKRAEYAAHREEFAAQKRAWRAANPEKAKEQDRKRSAIRKAESPALFAYYRHKSRAGSRNIAFLLTFEEWLAIWTESGKFAQRGQVQRQLLHGAIWRCGTICGWQRSHLHGPRECRRAQYKSARKAQGRAQEDISDQERAPRSSRHHFSLKHASGRQP